MLLFYLGAMHMSSAKGGPHAKDWYVCASSIAIFCIMMLCFEKPTAWLWASVFGLCASAWGFWSKKNERS